MLMGLTSTSPTSATLSTSNGLTCRTGLYGRIRLLFWRMSRGPNRDPVRYDVPPSNGMPKSAASSPGSSRVWGRRMKVAGWANLGERNESAGRKSGILTLHAWMHRDSSTRPHAPSPVQSLRGRVLSCHCEARSVFCHCEERSDEAISGQGDRHAPPGLAMTESNQCEARRPFRHCEARPPFRHCEARRAEAISWTKEIPSLRSQ